MFGITGYEMMEEVLKLTEPNNSKKDQDEQRQSTRTLTQLLSKLSGRKSTDVAPDSTESRDLSMQSEPVRQAQSGAR